MIPVLFDSEQINQTLSKGKLIDILSCEVYEELNGDYSLEFTYPITGEHYKDLLNGGTIEVIAPTYQWGLHYVWFDIYKHSLPIDGVVTFYASHISRRLQNNYYTPTQLDPSLLNAVSFFNYCVPAYTATAEKPYFQFYNSDPITDNPVDVAPKSWLATLIGDEGSLVSEYGVDMAFRCMLNPAGSPTQYFPVCYVTHLTHRGADNGVEIRYGYNMTDIDHTIDKSGLFNAVVPFWDDGNGNRTFVTGYVVQPTTPITPVKVAVLDCTDYYETQPTEAQLITTAQNYLDQNQPWTISETLTVDFINGVEIDPNAAPIELGDTVHVYWNDADVSASLRVISYRYDVLAERYAELTLGTPQTQFVAVTGESFAGVTGGGGLPPGGRQGEALVKNSNADGDVKWGSPYTDTTSGNWTVRTWADGTVEAWEILSKSYAMTSASGSSYISGAATEYFPIGIFSATPLCEVTGVSSNGNFMTCGVLAVDNVKVQIFGRSAISQTLTISIHIYARSA